MIRGFQEWASALRSEEAIGLLNNIIEADDGEVLDYDGLLIVESLLAVLIGKPRSVGCHECLMIRRQTTNHR